MSDRVTMKQVRNFFPYFLRAIGKRPAKSYSGVGGYVLDYNARYGGVEINEIASKGGALSQPFGFKRRSPREMLATMRFAMDSIEVRSGRR